MDIPAATLARIQDFWDELADFDVARADAALDRLLGFLCELAGAQNAAWVGAVRMDDAQADDPARGWRARAIRYLHPTRALDEAAKEQVKLLDRCGGDAWVTRNAELAGSFRAHRLLDLMPESWLDSAYYRLYYTGVGHEDGIWAGVPINADAEAYFGVLRDVGRGRFDAAERDAVACALRGLRWFHRKQMLGHGLLVADAPLTPTERKVLRQLLSGLSDKQIAASVGQSHHTTREYVANLYEKFGVNGRAALMALWIGKAGE